VVEDGPSGRNDRVRVFRFGLCACVERFDSGGRLVIRWGGSEKWVSRFSSWSLPRFPVNFHSGSKAKQNFGDAPEIFVWLKVRDIVR
jgi:hypothetical protein